MSENTKRFKAFRNELNESEYKETLTGYPNRGIDTDVGPANANLMVKVNSVLNTLNRFTHQHTNDAMIKIRTRLNLFMLDFPWTPWMWQSGTIGTFAVPVTLFGRVDGVDGVGGGIRFDGRANPNAGLQEFTLSISVETSEDGLYRVTAKLQPRAELVPEGVEEDGDAVTEDYQTDARAKEMERKIAKQDDRADRAYTTKMNSPSHKKAKAAEKRLDKTERKVNALLAQDRKEQDSPRTYGRGGKVVKRGSRAEVKEGAEQIEEMHKVGDTVKVPHKGKMVKGKIVRHDKGGSGKAAQHGGGYVVDVGEYSSITVPHHKIVKEELVGGQKKLDVNKNKKLDAQDFKMLRAKKKPVQEETVEEALIGGQKSLDLNKNKRLDSQDFKMLRSKKKPVAEAKMKQWTPRLDKLLGSSRDAVRSKPKKSKILRKIKDGKVVSTKVIPAYTPKKAVKEYTEMLGGIPLTSPDPTAARADKSGKGKRFHKGAIKSVEEAVAKGKKKKPSPHQGAANVIGKNKAIKSRLEKHNMRW